MSSKRVCPNCGRKMKQQFIGLFHCKCGLSWKRDIGFFERTPNMVFALERIQAGKKVKQVPVIRYKQPIEGDTWQNQRLKNCQAKIFRLKLNDMSEQAMDRLLRLILYVRARSRRCSSFPNRTSLRWASVWGRPVCGFFLVGFNRLFQI